MTKSGKSFLNIRDEWYKKLKDEGFIDVEDGKGRLKQPDRRSILFDNREVIAEFFTQLHHFLTDNQDLPLSDRAILTLYSEGVFMTHISKRLSVNLWHVKNVVKKYKDKLLSSSVVDEDI